MTPEQIEQIRQLIREELNQGSLKTFSKDAEFLDGRNMRIGTNVGTKIGTATTQKIGFFNVTPVAQQGAISSPTADVNSLKTAVDAIRTALTNLGLTA